MLHGETLDLSIPLQLSLPLYLYLAKKGLRTDIPLFRSETLAEKRGSLGSVLIG